MSSSSTTSSPATDLLPCQLPHYLPDHKALICRTCRYAIQPKAISRHLKVIHAIHRARRRPYMSYVSTLDLATPEHVIQTQCKLGVCPVPELPIIEGLMCVFEGCGHLCASGKRVKSHWLAVHGIAAKAGVDWEVVRLQTFFKGNILKYVTDGIVINVGANCIAGSHADDIMNYECEKSNPGAIVPYPTPPTALIIDTSETALLNHFKISTASTLATNQATQSLWENHIPFLAESNEFLYHGILSCSALHLVHLNPHPPLKTQLSLIASQHQEAAMPLFRETLLRVTPQTCDAVLAFAHMLIIISFATDTENKNDQLMIVSPSAPPIPIHTINGSSNFQDSDSILPPWLYLLRAGCIILLDIWDILQLGPVSALAEQWEIPVQEPDGTSPPLLAHLLSLIPSSSTRNVFTDPNLSKTTQITGNNDSQDDSKDLRTWTKHELTTYISSARELDIAFRYREVLGAKFTAWDALRVWPMAISEAYLDMLSRKHEGALVLLGFYCVLLKMVEVRWYFTNRAQRLLRAVLAHLDEQSDAPKWRNALAWAIKEVGVGADGD